MRCSTVTPGKLATFCRRPVNRLNSVDLPEFGGPTMATMMGRSLAGRGGRMDGLGRRAGRGASPWQLLMKGSHFELHSLKYDEVRFGVAAYVEASRRIVAQRHFGAIHAEHPRSSARRFSTGDDF